MENILMMNEQDNVAVCLKDATSGETVVVEKKSSTEQRNITLVNDVPFAHKVALSHITAGEMIIKYGEVIGRATQDIAIGEWVHIHNVESTRARGDKNVK